MATKFRPKSQNCTNFSSAKEIEDFFCKKSKFSGVGEFKCAIRNLKGAEGVAMATKFRPK